MNKMYFKPAMTVLSLATTKDLLTTSPVTLTALGGANLSTPTTISGTWDSLFE